MKNSGTVYYLDHYGTEYEVSWFYSGVNADTLDITTITRQPTVWGEQYSSGGSSPELRGGYIQDRKLYRRGIITTKRQLIKTTSEGYEIISEGQNQEIGYFAATRSRNTTFSHYLDNSYLDQDEVGSEDAGFCDVPPTAVSPKWGDPDNPAATDIVFIDVWA